MYSFKFVSVCFILLQNHWINMFGCNNVWLVSPALWWWSVELNFLELTQREQLRCSSWTLRWMSGRLQLIVYNFKRSLARGHLEQSGRLFWMNPMENLEIGQLLQNVLHVRSCSSSKTNSDTVQTHLWSPPYKDYGQFFVLAKYPYTFLQENSINISNH